MLKRSGQPKSPISDKSRRRLRRRLTGAVLLLVGLGVAGGLAATLTPTPQVAVVGHVGEPAREPALSGR